MAYLRFIAALGVMLLPLSSVHATTQNDAYIAGYAAGVLKHVFKRDTPLLVVQDGIISFPVEGIEPADRIKVVQLLSEIPGVSAVNISETTSRQPIPAPENPVSHEVVQVTDSNTLPTGLLPAGHLFKPLLADPRWAHFSAAYRNYQSDNFDGNDIVSVSFGETIPFYRSNFGRSTVQWEAGLQAGVFSDFNLNAPSSDLVNTDFIASIYSSARAGHFSAFARLLHQSSHLGDEFLLRNINSKFQRVNLSYEGVDLRLSYELPYGLRIYGGGGGLFHREPATLKAWLTQYGIEYRSPWRSDFASLRPIVAVDIKHFEENNWNADISARAGVEFENLQVLSRKLEILAEYYNGFSPSGQFYNNKVEYLGLGAHYHF